MKTIARVIVTVLVTLFFTVAVSAATFVVNTTSDTADASPGDGNCLDNGGMCSFRAAVSEANAFDGDDIITLPAGTYTQSLVAADEDNNAGGDWDIRSNITINGAGQDTTILQAAATPATATERVLESPLNGRTVVINGVTIRHGNKTGTDANTTRGGGIRNVGNMTINDSTITLNNSTHGGGIRNDTSVTLNNVMVSYNGCNSGTATGGGGMDVFAFGVTTTVINNSVFTNNTATSSTGNGVASGAGLYVIGPSSIQLSITGSSFTNNHGFGSGTGGSAGNGIYIQAFFNGNVDISNSVISGNGGSGGSVNRGSGITVNSVSVGTLTGTWDKITVANNTANEMGGGVLFMGGGAAVINISLNNSTISGNSAAKGGGLALTNDGGNINITANLRNTTVSGNSASGDGGGIYLEKPVTGPGTDVTANLNFSTVADNVAGATGGGLSHPSGTLNLKNSLVANNSGTGPDIVGTVNSQDYNHIENTAGATFTGATANNVTGTDPLLGPLANNGGPTLTHMLRGDSPVLNTIPGGTNDCGTTVTTEQRGIITRPSGSGCEKGSVEVINLPPGPWNLSGIVHDTGNRPLRNVQVILSGGGLAPVTFYTGSFGQYVFFNLPANTYTVQVISKRFTFPIEQIQVDLGSDVTTADFIADNIFGGRTPAKSQKR